MKQHKPYLMRMIVFTFAMVLTLGSLTTFARTSNSSIEAQMRAMVDNINLQLEQRGEAFRIGEAEYITQDGANEVGTTIFFNDVGNRQLNSHWVRGDVRRGGFTDIAYIVDQVDAAPGLTIGTTTAAIDRAMNSWDNVNCSDIPIFKLADVPGFDIGFVQFLSGLGGAPFPIFDVTHAGWLPLAPGVLGVTFTFNFVGGDTNGDGRNDTAFREIYYNVNEPWGINTGFPFDVETIALHEAGHALSQAHFGKLFRTDSNGKFHFAPRALMNAGYTGVQQSVRATDKAGHCSIWASWGSN